MKRAGIPSRRPTGACNTCGRLKRLTDAGKMPPHHPPGKPGLKCYETEFTPARPERKPQKPRARLAPINRRRAARQRLEDFGPQAEWMRTLPCAICGAPAPSEPSHVKTRGAGGNRDHMIPSCPDCHVKFHAGPETFEAEWRLIMGSSLTLRDLAAHYARAWSDLPDPVQKAYGLIFRQRWPEAGRFLRG